MKRVNLTKYGFVRWPEEDFTDDGNRFTCYRAGKAVRVSKLISDGQIYLSIDSSCGNGTLPYEIYSKLPYYKEANWSYNGMSVEDLTEDDIQAFYEACIEYETAYIEEEAHLVYPAIEEIKDQCKKLTLKYMKELDEIESIMKMDKIAEIALKFSDCEWKELKHNIAALVEKVYQVNPDTYPAKIYKQAYSFNFVSPENYDLNNPTFYYEDTMKMFKKYNII